jgi:hypothetical protein
MTPEIFATCDRLFRANPEQLHPFLAPMPDVPVSVARGLVFTAWRPSPQELALLQGGGVVALVMQGETIPPLRINVVRTADTLNGMAKA